MKTIHHAGCPVFVTVLSFALSSFSLSAIPFMEQMSDPVQTYIGYLIAAAFWIFLLVGISSVLITAQKQKRVKGTFSYMESSGAAHLPGVISFSLTPVSIAIYSIMLIGLLFIVSDIIFHWMTEYIIFPVISITLFAFTLHGVIDGKTYKVYKAIKEGMGEEHDG